MVLSNAENRNKQDISGVSGFKRAIQPKQTMLINKTVIKILGVHSLEIFDTVVSVITEIR
jgi:hypothetical protein